MAVVAVGAVGQNESGPGAGCPGWLDLGEGDATRE